MRPPQARRSTGAAALAGSLLGLACLPAFAQGALTGATGGTIGAAPLAAAGCRLGRVELIVGGSAGPGSACGALGASPGAPREFAPPRRDALVDPSTQRVRDDERVAILRNELAQEEARLRLLEHAGAPDDDIRAAKVRTRDNVAALKRELGRAP